MSKEPVLLNIVSQMKFHTYASLAAIYGSIDKDIGELVGTGTFINIRDQPYLLTAGHVALEKSKYNELTHTRSNAMLPARFTNPFHILNNLFDICIVKVEIDELNQTSIVPVDSSRIAHHSNDLDNDILFIHGYPGARSKSVRLLKAIFSKTLPFGTSIGNTVYPWFDSRYHFALDYPQTGLLDEGMLPVLSDDPHGLSGAIVWKTNHVRWGTNWVPSHAEIVGVVHTWDDNFHSLIATRIEVVREFILKTLRREFAYYHWLDRGSPESDDWNDWFVACKQIPNI